MTRVLVRIAICLSVLSVSTRSSGADEDVELLQGEFWRNHVLEDLAPLWYSHVIDAEFGAFYTNLGRDWQPRPPWVKIPAMISRQVYSFSAAYMLSGDDRYLTAARSGADYLMDHGWDHEYGGWFGQLARDGTPTDTSKAVPHQLYTNVGLALYYFASGDQRALDLIERSVAIRRSAARDEQFGGYYHTLNRDLSVRTDRKTKHAHYGYVGSLAHLFLATRDPSFLEWEMELMDLSTQNMIDGELGWIYGYTVPLDRRWQLITAEDPGQVVVGAQLTAALAYLRLYHQSGEDRYLEQGTRLAEVATARGWDADNGGWYQSVARLAPHTPSPDPFVHWWIQMYGSFLQLQMYRVTGDPVYLQRFQAMESYFTRFFTDRQYGGVFIGVSHDGEFIGDRSKAEPWQTAYHEVEHGLLNYLYLNLYVNDLPATLHLHFPASDRPHKRFVSLVDDPTVLVTAVTVDGEPWQGFDAQERSVTLSPGSAVAVTVTLE